MSQLVASKGRRGALQKQEAPGAFAERYLQQARTERSRIKLTFVLLVLLPTMLAAAYYAFAAAPQFVSEARFVVRGLSAQRATGLESLFRTFGISRDVDDAFTVQSYLMSREALRDLEKEVPLRQLFQRPEADLLSRFPRPWRRDSAESLFDYYQDRVAVLHDGTKGISVLKVTAFSPEDARLLAATLLKLGERKANQINERARADAIGYAEAEVERAQQSVIDSQIAITNFRSRELLIDPSQSAARVIELIGKLSVELAQVNTQLDQSRRLTSASPLAEGLIAKANAIQGQIDIQRNRIVGGDNSLSSKISEYERLSLGRGLADKNLESAMAALQSARDDARRQQIYLETAVMANLPDEPTEPRRIRMTATVFVLCFAAFAVFWILSAGAKEHAQ